MGRRLNGTVYTWQVILYRSDHMWGTSVSGNLQSVWLSTEKHFSNDWETETFLTNSATSLKVYRRNAKHVKNTQAYQNLMPKFERKKWFI